jgi:hypothetical protein
MAKIANPKYEFNPFEGRNIPRTKIKEAREAVKEFVLEKVLSYVADAKSPVSGESWKASLDPEYAKKKKAVSGSSKANLELYGDMLDALDIRIQGNKLILLVDDPSQAGKSDGHNNFSGESKLPQRRFIPEEGQKFKSDIERGIDEVISQFEVDDGGD